MDHPSGISQATPIPFCALIPKRPGSWTPRWVGEAPRDSDSATVRRQEAHRFPQGRGRQLVALVAGSRGGHEPPSPVLNTQSPKPQPRSQGQALQGITCPLLGSGTSVAPRHSVSRPNDLHGRLGWAGSRPGEGCHCQFQRPHQPRLHRWLLKRSAASRALASHRLSRGCCLHPRRARPRPRRQPRWSYFLPHRNSCDCGQENKDIASFALFYVK